MAILDILHYPDPRLRRHAEVVDQIDETVQTLVDDMLETMYHAPGIGLAATQVNVAKRVLVLDVSERKSEPRCFINPELLECWGEAQSEEGCLSVPNICDDVTRYERVRVRAWDRHGARFEIEADGVLAICLQHEMDHLDGKLFIDYLSAFKRNRLRKQLEKAARQNKSSPMPARRRTL